MAGIRRVLDALRRETPVLTRQAEDYPVLRSRAAGDTPVDPTGIPISALPGADTPTDNDVVAGVQSETTKKFRLGSLLAWIKNQLSPADIGAQSEILISGLLKGNGVGGISAAQPGTDYGTYSKPSGGIPSTDMTSAVQTSLGKADSAYQKPSGGIPASDLANGVIPTVPSVSTANPQMDGAASPGSTGKWADGGHVHPTDTTRAAAALEINGHPLTGDFDLTAADVGALASNGTAHSSYTLFPTKVYSGSLAAGWYKFAEVNITDTAGRAKITFKYGLSNSNYDFIGEIFVYKTNRTTMNCTMQIPYSVSGKITYFRYNIDSATTVSFYVYKHDASGNPVFTFITSENKLGEYLDPSTYMLESLVAETPPATALKPIYSAINRWLYNVPVSPGTNQQILSYSHNMITSASVLAKIEFANPEYIKSDCSWETTDGTNPNDNGTITLTGTCTAATTANLLILNVLPD